MVLLRVKGPRACFTRPELKVEAVSYDVMTPTAAKAILGAIYRKPEMDWIIDGIHVINPIQTSTIMINGITDKINMKNVLSGKIKPMQVERKRDQRNMTFLRNVDYVIKAHFDIISGNDHPGKHISTFQRRAENGQCYRYPYFGCREFSVEKFYLVNKLPVSALKGTIRLGYILHSIDHEHNHSAFFDAVIEDGYMRIPPVDAPEIKR